MKEFAAKDLPNRLLGSSTIEDKNSLYEVTDGILFSTRVADITKRNYITVGNDESIRRTASLMAKNRTGSIVVVDAHGQPVGVVTDRDFREKVVAVGRNVEDSVTSIMGPVLIRADANDCCYEAMLKMIKYDAQHILVIKDGEFRGLLTSEDLLSIQGDSPFSFARDIKQRNTIEDIVRLSGRMSSIIGFLMREGARASVVARIISDLRDRMTEKALSIAEKRFGAAPVEYCWMTFGSEGRRELLLDSDFDCGLIYADPESSIQMQSARKYFDEFAHFMVEALRRCGFIAGPRNSLASQSEWRQSLSVWKKNFSEWILYPSGSSVAHSLKLLDFRAVGGDESLSGSLRDHIDSLLGIQDDYLAKMATLISRKRQSSKLISGLRMRVHHASLDKQLDIKKGGLEPLADAVRLLALALSVTASSTDERIAGVKRKDPGIARQCDEMADALDFMKYLEMRHQIDLAEKGKTSDSLIEIGRLRESEIERLRIALQAVRRVLDGIADYYRLRLIGV